MSGEDRDEGQAHQEAGASILRTIDANFKLIASILSTLVVVVGALLTLSEQGWIIISKPPTMAPPPTETQTLFITDTPIPSATATHTPTPTSTPTASPPSLLEPDPGATVHNNDQPITFEWTGRLADGEQYVLIINHWSADCHDVKCTDVHWLEGSGTSYRLPKRTFFLWEENKRSDRKDWPVTWEVWIVDSKAPVKLQNKPPAEGAIRATSVPREITIQP